MLWFYWNQNMPIPRALAVAYFMLLSSRTRRLMLILSRWTTLSSTLNEYGKQNTSICAKEVITSECPGISSFRRDPSLIAVKWTSSKSPMRRQWYNSSRAIFSTPSTFLVLPQTSPTRWLNNSEPTVVSSEQEQRIFSSSLHLITFAAFSLLSFPAPCSLLLRRGTFLASFPSGLSLAFNNFRQSSMAAFLQSSPAISITNSNPTIRWSNSPSDILRVIGTPHVKVLMIKINDILTDTTRAPDDTRSRHSTNVPHNERSIESSRSIKRQQCLFWLTNTKCRSYIVTEKGVYLVHMVWERRKSVINERQGEEWQLYVLYSRGFVIPHQEV